MHRVWHTCEVENQLVARTENLGKGHTLPWGIPGWHRTAASLRRAHVLPLHQFPGCLLLHTPASSARGTRRSARLMEEARVEPTSAHLTNTPPPGSRQDHVSMTVLVLTAVTGHAMSRLAYLAPDVLDRYRELLLQQQGPESANGILAVHLTFDANWIGPAARARYPYITVRQKPARSPVYPDSRRVYPWSRY